MKKHISVLIVLLFGTAAILISFQNIIIKVKVQTAEARMEPAADSAVVKQLAFGELLEARSKLGEWYEIAVTDSSGNIVSAYIHSSAVDVISAPEITPPQKQPVQQPRDMTPEGTVYDEYPSPRGKILSGFYMKFGVIDKGWGDWVGSIGYDLNVYKMISLGLEVQPSYYNIDDPDNQIKMTIVPVNLFVNLKAGTSLTRLKPELDFVTLYGGLGGGLTAVRSEAKIEGTSSSVTQTEGSLHLIGGLELDANKIGLIFEYQLIRVMNPSSSKNPFVGWVVFGIRL